MPKEEPVIKQPKRPLFQGGVSDLVLSVMVRNLSLMLKSGLDLQAALTILSEQTENFKLQKALLEIMADIQKGVSLGKAMEKHQKIFSQIVISIIKVGEEGGTLEKNLSYLSDYLKKKHELAKKIRGALLYPVIIFSLTIAEMLGVIFFILPTLDTLFSSFEEIPEFTRFVMDSARFVRVNGLYILGILIILVIIARFLLKTNTGKIFKDRVSISFPIVKKLVKLNILTTFSRTLGILLDNGIHIAKALEITARTTNNHYYQKVIREVHEEVKGGKNLSKVLANYPDYFPVTFTKMMEIGEQTGTLQENLMYSYEFFSEDVQEMSANLATILEPIVLVIVGIMIGGLAIIIVGPIYQLTSSLN